MVVGDGVDTDIQSLLSAIESLDQLLKALFRWEEDGVDKDVGSTLVVVVVVVVGGRGDWRRGNNMTAISVIAMVGGIKKSLEPGNLISESP